MPTHVFETMGTVVSLAFRDDLPAPHDLDSVERLFGEWDERFSLYRTDSELSAVAAGSLALPNTSEQLRSMYALAAEWRAATSGAFTAHRPDGVLDLSGIVKAAAIDAAAGHLSSRSYRNWAINVGGDVLVAPESARPWTLGIVDPADRGEFLTSVLIAEPRRACATSGTSERGDHIWRTTPSPDFAQATVLADDIITADVLATAIIAGGVETLDLACRTWSIDVITVAPDGALRMTPGAVAAMHAASELAADQTERSLGQM